MIYKYDFMNDVDAGNSTLTITMGLFNVIDSILTIS